MPVRRGLVDEPAQESAALAERGGAAHDEERVRGDVEGEVVAVGPVVPPFVPDGVLLREVPFRGARRLRPARVEPGAHLFPRRRRKPQAVVEQHQVQRDGFALAATVHALGSAVGAERQMDQRAGGPGGQRPQRDQLLRAGPVGVHRQPVPVVTQHQPRG
ncbi:hypothetical protein [Streptomyces scabiei]|uniref:hypothetical protein n=1 Tax=Streptomyces scabiei TaxID=1930 RepID=UPI001B3241B5|nr:hypothetical protein [Streptomyces sp. LBUM 1487]